MHPKTVPYTKSNYFCLFCANFENHCTALVMIILYFSLTIHFQFITQETKKCQPCIHKQTQPNRTIHEYGQPHLSCKFPLHVNDMVRCLNVWPFMIPMIAVIIPKLFLPSLMSNVRSRGCLLYINIIIVCGEATATHLCRQCIYNKACFVCLMNILIVFDNIWTRCTDHSTAGCTTDWPGGRQRLSSIALRIRCKSTSEYCMAAFGSCGNCQLRGACNIIVIHNVGVTHLFSL